MGMTREQIFSYACKSQWPDEPMNQPQMLLYYCCKDISARYRAGEINKTAVKDEKRTAFLDFERDMAEYNNSENALQYISEIYKDIEFAANAYRNDRTKENADKLLAVIVKSKPY